MGKSLRYGSIDRPSAGWSMSEVLDKGVVAWLPTIEICVADEAGDIVEAVGGRPEEEASLSKLQINQSVRDICISRVGLTCSAGRKLCGHVTAFPPARFLTDDARRFAR